MGETPRFVLNLPAFLDSGAVFDLDGFREAAEIATVTMTLLCPNARRLALGFADLDGLLAGLGLDYDSAAARDVAACLAALLRGRAECASARLAGITGLGVQRGFQGGAPRTGGGSRSCGGGPAGFRRRGGAGGLRP